MLQVIGYNIHKLQPKVCQRRQPSSDISGKSNLRWCLVVSIETGGTQIPVLEHQLTVRHAGDVLLIS
jgi:hypothetical protein